MKRHPLHGLESPICDVFEMAEVAVNLIGEHIVGPHNHQRELGRPMPLTEEEARQISFCVYHLRSMISDLKASFYDCFRSGRAN